MKLWLIEDNDADVKLIKYALSLLQDLTYDLEVITDGESVIAMLLSEKVPDLISLDWNIPKIDGKELLKSLKSDPELYTIPVVILTTSVSDIDIRHAYQYHANAYVVKPFDLDDFISAIHALGAFWTKWVKLL